MLIHASKFSQDLSESCLEMDGLNGTPSLPSRTLNTLVSLVGLSDKTQNALLNENF